MNDSPTAYEVNYVKKLTFDQILAHLEFLGSLLFFGAKKAIGQTGKCDWEALADTVEYATLERVQSVPLAMSFLGKVGLFSKQKYKTIRDNLQLMGYFVVQSVPGSQGPRQDIGELLDLNLRKIVELVRDLCDRIHEIIIDPEGHSLWPNHGFAFLMRWHTRVFGYHPGDRDHSAEIKATALNDREELWQRTLHHEQVDEFVAQSEKKALQEFGWGEEAIENVRSRLAYPEDWDQEAWFKLCPDIVRLSPAESKFLGDTGLVLCILGHDNRMGMLSDQARNAIGVHRIQALAAIQEAVAFAQDRNNGARKGRSIADAHPWAWDLVVHKRATNDHREKMEVLRSEAKEKNRGRDWVADRNWVLGGE